MTKSHLVMMIMSVWAFSLMTPLPTAFHSQLIQQIQVDELSSSTSPQNINQDTKLSCMEEWGEWSDYKYYYSMGLMILQYIFPLLVMCVTYLRIGFALWWKKTPGEAEIVRDSRIATLKRKVRRNLKRQKVKWKGSMKPKYIMRNG